jgi:hypothetical protein
MMTVSCAKRRRAAMVTDGRTSRRERKALRLATMARITI